MAHGDCPLNSDSTNKISDDSFYLLKYVDVDDTQTYHYISFVCEVWLIDDPSFEFWLAM